MSTHRPQNDNDRVRHILEAAALLDQFAAEGRAIFDTSNERRLAAERLLITIGEAGRNLSDSFIASRPTLAIVGARGMRNFLVHQYDHVDPELVWDAITTSVPDFVAALTIQPEVSPPAPYDEPPELHI